MVARAAARPAEESDLILAAAASATAAFRKLGDQEASLRVAKFDVNLETSTSLDDDAGIEAVKDKILDALVDVLYRAVDAGAWARLQGSAGGAALANLATRALDSGGLLEVAARKVVPLLEEARRAWYFPAVDGYKLRFSFNENFLGFKELLLEQLRGTLRLLVTPGIDASGRTQKPTVTFSFEGSGDGLGQEPGAPLRFLGEGVSLVSRRARAGAVAPPAPRLDGTAWPLAQGCPEASSSEQVAFERTGRRCSASTSATSRG